MHSDSSIGKQIAVSCIVEFDHVSLTKLLGISKHPLCMLKIWTRGKSKTNTALSWLAWHILLLDDLSPYYTTSRLLFKKPHDPGFIFRVTPILPTEICDCNHRMPVDAALSIGLSIIGAQYTHFYFRIDPNKYTIILSCPCRRQRPAAFSMGS